MARIKMPASCSAAKQLTFSEAFETFLTGSAARGLTDRTLRTYRTHFHSISLYLDIECPLGSITRDDINEIVVI